MALSEETFTNQIARHERAIAGVKQSFDFAKNPDNLHPHYPCVLHYPPNFSLESAGHHNLWADEVVVRSVLFVMPREAQGGKLRYIENAALPFAYRWREKFKAEAVVKDLLAQLGAQRAYLRSGEYSPASLELTYGGVAHVGWVFEFVARATG